MLNSLFSTWRPAAAVLLGCLLGTGAQAQYTSDIDIYTGGTGGGNAPNVLFMLDSSANWNAKLTHNCKYSDDNTSPSKGQTKGGLEQCALYNAIAALEVPPTGGAAKVNIGLMVFNETNVSTGARVIKAFTPLDSAGRTAIMALIRTLDQNQSPAPTSYALGLHEAYLYFKEQAPYGGQRAGQLPYDPKAFSGGKYTLSSSGGTICSKGYVVILANGPPQNDWNNISNDQVKTMLAGLGGDTAPITYPAGNVDSKDSANWTDEYARFLNESGISSYTIAVTGASSDKATYPNIFRGIAKAGGADFYEANTEATLKFAFDSILSQLQAVDSVFASASLPVSVNARGTYLNQVFMGMFRPDEDAKPRWRGNLKQYQFSYDVTTDSLSLAGANGEAAISTTSGFISPTAISFWTKSETNSFWINQRMGTPPSASDSPDGEVVEKGGVAQQIRMSYATSQAGRKLYTCIGCAKDTVLSSTATAQFSTANASNLTAVAADSTARNTLIDWVRGTDNAGDERGPGGTTTIRPGVHGDVLHSRPAVVNYGGTTGIVVFYGSNDGMIRAINGNKPTGPTDTTAGKELWGFLPEEHFPKFKRLRDNAPEIRLSTTDAASSATPRDYFVDGPISIYQKVGTDPKVYLYAAMRRGGRFIYALDVTDPAAPKYLWRKAFSDTDMGKLGQTWSEPRVTKIKGMTDPVIVMGGGYDAAAEDAATPGTTTMGNAVFVLNALTGAFVHRFDTDRSVPADVSLFDSDSDGYTDRAYAVDTGGNIYRIDFETPTSSAKTDWGIYKVAALAGTGTRKFFYAPDIVPTKTFTAILVGSGDREKPLAKTGADAFFTVYDERLTKGTPASFTTITTLGRVGSTESKANGCYIPMDTGEKVVNAATTFRGITYFGTNQPYASTAACTTNLGRARSYAAPLFCKNPTSDELAGGGLPPSPVAGFVTITYTPPGSDNPVTIQKGFVIGGTNPKKSGIEASNPPSKVNVPRKRRYWYQDNAR